MPTYFYTAITATGEKVSGSEAAQDERTLANILREKGYLLTAATTEHAKKKILSFGPFLNRLHSVSLADKLLFTRNLQVMVAAGVPLPRALDILSVQTESKSFRKVLLEIKKEVVEGKNLSESMGNYPAIFSELFTNMIKVGEGSGTLEQVLQQLTLQLERSHELRSKILGALLYPSVVIAAMLGVGTLMLIVVIPQLAATFADLNVPLPLTTRVVIAFGTFLSKFWYIAFPAFFGSLVLAFQLTKTRQGKRAFDAFILKAPLFGGITQKLNAALMTRTLSSLIAAGVPIVRALEITSKVLGNVYFQDSLGVCAQRVGKGEKLSAALKSYGRLYPVVVVQMVEVGEETGETGNILAKLAEFYEEGVTQVTKNLTSIIEPILMLIIGATVGFFAISMIQPIYGMLSAL
ncbi:MAG: type II secretion system F family protein [Candidatus Wildermuthbacteria bacterium]|nr:type II secretion system F family protein [Candidatus Wildermuthbacteria bacterium]